MTTQVEHYFSEGCGRCPLGGTPACKVHRWQAELRVFQRIVLECGLEEACKWGMPCYTFQGKNVAMISAFNDSCTLSFFKGGLLQNEDGILSSAGANAQAARLVRVTNVSAILDMEDAIKKCLFEAIEVEKAGLKLPRSSAPALPDELLRQFEAMPAFKAAFEALTPGRQRGYLLHFTAPKQSQTRIARIERCLPRILEGKGMQD